MFGKSSRRFLFNCIRHAFTLAALVIVVLCCAATWAAPIAAGNLVLVRAAGGPNGDASSALGGSGLAAAVFLDEYTTSGVFVQSIAMPRTANATVGGQRALTLSGTQNLEGHITLSGNGQYFIMGGYNQTANVAGTSGLTTNTVERVVGRIDFNGNIDTTTALVDFAFGSASSIRSAYSTDGVNFWVTGNGTGTVTVGTTTGVLTSGVHYAQLGTHTGGTTQSVQLNTTGLVTNNRYVLAFGPNLYVSNGNTSSPAATARGVDVMDNGIPTTSVAGQIIRSLAGFPTGTHGNPLSNPQSDDYWFLDDNTIYLADNRSDGNGGIQKWTLSAGTWNYQYTLATGMASLVTPANKVGVHGLTGSINGTGNAVLFGTTFDAGANINQFFTVTDTGASASVSFLGTSATNTAFRGIEIAQLPPQSSVPEPGSIGLLVLGVIGTMTSIRRRR